MPRCKPGGTPVAPSSTPTSPPPGATDTTAAHGASEPTPKELHQLLNKANKGDKQAFDSLCTRLDGNAWFWEQAGNMAYQAQETMLIGFLGAEALLTHDAQRRKCAALRRELEGPAPTPIERLLVDRVVLCWLHLHYIEALYAQNMMQLSLMQHDFYQRRLSMAQRRYLAAIRPWHRCDVCRSPRCR